MIVRTKTSHLILLLSLFCFVACKSTEKKTTESTTYKGLALKWGDRVQYDFNDDRSMVLAQSLPESNAKSLRFSYFVFDMQTEKIRTEGTVESGAVQWLSRNEIEVFNTPGKMGPNKTRDDYTMVIDVFTGIHTPKTEWKK